MTALTVQVDRRIDCSVEAAWRFVAERYFDNHGRWDPAVVGMEKLTAEPIGVGTCGVETRRFGGKQRAHFEVTRFDPPASFEFRNTSGPFALQRAYRLHDDGSGTTLSFSFRMAPKGPAKLAFPLLRKTIARQVTQNIDRLCGLVAER